jgi:hypothetical protein
MQRTLAMPGRIFCLDISLIVHRTATVEAEQRVCGIYGTIDPADEILKHRNEMADQLSGMPFSVQIGVVLRTSRYTTE